MRLSSARPDAQSSQWWTVRIASATSASPERRGSADALARTTGAAPAGRWAIMTVEGSIASTLQCTGS